MTALETSDPRVAIHDKEVKVRAAAARDLGRVGTWDDMPVLIELATAPRSSAAVAVYTAAAACDIAHRLRLHGGLDHAQQDQLFAWATSIDPDQNPGLLMLMSSVRPEKVLSRLGRMLRGQRSGVRAGAAKALLRMASPRLAMGEDEPRDTVGRWLLDRQFQRYPDTVEALVRLVGACGWSELAPSVTAVRDVARGLDEVVDECLDRLAAQSDVSAWSGVYVSDGRDVSEVGEGSAPRLLVVHEGQAFVDGEPLAFDKDAERVRLCWFNRHGTTEEYQRALQLRDATWWSMPPEELQALLGEALEAGTTGLPELALRGIAAHLARQDDNDAQRLAGITHLSAGDPAAAKACFDALLEGKRAKTEWRYWRALACAGLGEREAAVADLEAFLAKAGKKAAHREQAEQRLAELSA